MVRILLIALIALIAVTLPVGCSCGSTNGPPTGSDAERDAPLDVEATEDGYRDDRSDDAGDDACAAAALEGNVLGCDYVALSPSRTEYFERGFPYGCLAVVVINRGDRAVRLDVTWKGAAADMSTSALLVTGTGRALAYEPLDTGDRIPPGRTAVVSLYQGELNQIATACPASPIQEGIYPAIDPGSNKQGHTFRIRTSEPVVAYQVWPYSQNNIDIQNVNALRAVPSWASSYIDVGTYVPQPPDSVATDTWTDIVASQDGTIVSLPSKDGSLVSATLDADEVLNVRRADLFLGSVVTASVPFGLWTGSCGYEVPFNAVTGAAAALPVPPVSEWGQTFAFARQDNRFPDVDERTVFRLVAAVDGTTLTWSPSPPGAAPTALDAAQWALFDTHTPFVVRSQDAAHPIFLAAHMVDTSDLKDPETTHQERGQNTLLAVPPVERFGSRYDFFTPINFPNTELVVMRARGNADVTLDCAGALAGWQDIDESFEFTRAWLTRDTDGTFNPEGYPGGVCDNGVHSIWSDDAFSVMVYGWISEPFSDYNSLPPPQNLNAVSAYTYTPLAGYATKSPKDAGPAN